MIQSTLAMFHLGIFEIFFAVPVMLISVGIPVLVVVLLFLIYQKVCRIEDKLNRIE